MFLEVSEEDLEEALEEEIAALLGIHEGNVQTCEHYRLCCLLYDYLG